jgi:hypothetical protein
VRWPLINEIIPPKNYALVSHDAGGAFILRSLAKELEGCNGLLLGGPALKVFENSVEKYGEFNFQNKIDLIDMVITGTSSTSTLEIDAIKEARKFGIRTATFIDHWSNYRPRFEREGVIQLPDEIWVGDAYGLELARKEFPELKTFLYPNPYIKEVLNEIAAATEFFLPSKSLHSSNLIPNQKILYLTEPAGKLARNLSNNTNLNGYSEFDAVEYFLDRLIKKHPNQQEIRMRVHPSEDQGKYSCLESKYPYLKFEFSSSSLGLDIAAADIVIGTHSMGLAIAALAGKIAISAVPPGGIPCILPHKEIYKIEEIWAS